jgi:hypothetical protein
MAFSPQAYYTDWETATGWWIWMPTFVDRGVLRGQRSGIPTAINLTFLDWSCYFFLQVAPYLSSWHWVDPVPDPLLLIQCGCARNRTWDLWVCSQELWPLGHRRDQDEKFQNCVYVQWSMSNVESNCSSTSPNNIKVAGLLHKILIIHEKDEFSITTFSKMYLLLIPKYYVREYKVT